MNSHTDNTKDPTDAAVYYNYYNYYYPRPFTKETSYDQYYGNSLDLNPETGQRRSSDYQHFDNDYFEKYHDNLAFVNRYDHRNSLESVWGHRYDTDLYDYYHTIPQQDAAVNLRDNPDFEDQIGYRRHRTTPMDKERKRKYDFFDVVDDKEDTESDKADRKTWSRQLFEKGLPRVIYVPASHIKVKSRRRHKSKKIGRRRSDSGKGKVRVRTVVGFRDADPSDYVYEDDESDDVNGYRTPEDKIVTRFDDDVGNINLADNDGYVIVQDDGKSKDKKSDVGHYWYEDAPDLPWYEKDTIWKKEKEYYTVHNLDHKPYIPPHERLDHHSGYGDSSGYGKLTGYGDHSGYGGGYESHGKKPSKKCHDCHKTDSNLVPLFLLALLAATLYLATVLSAALASKRRRRRSIQRTDQVMGDQTIDVMRNLYQGIMKYGS